MSEVIRSMENLQRALRLAREKGECTIETVDGATFQLTSTSLTYDDELDPGLVESLERAMDQARGNQGQSTADVLSRLESARRKAHG